MQKIYHAENLTRLVNCNGSRLMAGEKSPAVSGGDEGIAAQYAAAMIIAGQATAQQLINQAAPNGVLITDTMISHVLIYTNAIRQNGAIYDQANVNVSFGSGNWKIEAIAHHISLTGSTLYVDEFAYGWGIVEPEHNWKLIACAVGFCIVSNAKPETIVLTVHQPRPSHPLGQSREITIDYKTLMQRRASIFEVCSHPSDTLRTGLSWCRKCPGLYSCPAARGAAMNAIDYASQAEKENLDDETLSREIDDLRTASAAIEERLKAVEETAAYRIKQGGVIPNYALEKHYGNRKFKPFVTPEMLTMLTGVANVTNQKMLSPVQIEALGVSKEVINSLCDRDETKPKLTRIEAAKLAKHLLKG